MESFIIVLLYYIVLCKANKNLWGNLGEKFIPKFKEGLNITKYFGTDGLEESLIQS